MVGYERAGGGDGGVARTKHGSAGRIRVYMKCRGIINQRSRAAPNGQEVLEFVIAVSARNELPLAEC